MNDSSNVGGVLVFIFLGLLIYLAIAYVLSRVFIKAGRPPWPAFVPIYNTWVLFEISGKPGWWVLLGLIPFAGGIIMAVLSLLASLELAKKFNKSTVFAVFGLWLFSIIGYLILATDNSTYQAAAPPASPQPPQPPQSPRPPQPVV